LHLKDFAQHIGTKDPSCAAHHMRRAEQAGLMRKIGWVGGWVAGGQGRMAVVRIAISARNPLDSGSILAQKWLTTRPSW